MLGDFVMSKKIFNILLVCLVLFIAIYFSLKISDYGNQLKDADDEFNNAKSVVTYEINVKPNVYQNWE